MSEISKFHAADDFSGELCVYATDFDRVTAERDALQERLNAADQSEDDLQFQLKDREGSRRDWFEEAQRLQVELAERDALLEEFATEMTLAITDSEVRAAMTSVGRSRFIQLLQDHNARLDAALSASAEPKCSKCGDSSVIDDKEIDELPGGYFTERGLVACPDCEEPSAPVSSTSDKYKAELYDEVWQLARDMGFGNVTDALMKLKKQPAPVAVVLPERDMDDIGRFTDGWNACLDEVARLNPPQQ